MKPLRVFYHHYYQFYTKIIPDDQPNATVIFVLSFIEALFINGILEYLMINFFCVGISKWPMIMVMVFILLINYFFYYRSGRFKAIIEEKPVFWGNERLSMLLTAGISLLIVSWMFWGAILGKSLLETCSS
jgi:hypothetical protein